MLHSHVSHFHLLKKIYILPTCERSLWNGVLRTSLYIILLTKFLFADEWSFDCLRWAEVNLSGTKLKKNIVANFNKCSVLLRQSKDTNRNIKRLVYSQTFRALALRPREKPKPILKLKVISKLKVILDVFEIWEVFVITITIM